MIIRLAPRRRVGGRRGSNAGSGVTALLLRDLAEGRAALMPAGRPGDFAWLAGQLEELLKANPDRRELLVGGVEACRVAREMCERGPIGGADRGGRFQLAEG